MLQNAHLSGPMLLLNRDEIFLVTVDAGRSQRQCFVDLQERLPLILSAVDRSTLPGSLDY